MQKYVLHTINFSAYKTKQLTKYNQVLCLKGNNTIQSTTAVTQVYKLSFVNTKQSTVTLFVHSAVHKFM
jgi:hypothetical protein